MKPFLILVVVIFYSCSGRIITKSGEHIPIVRITSSLDSSYYFLDKNMRIPNKTMTAVIDSLDLYFLNNYPNKSFSVRKLNLSGVKKEFSDIRKYEYIFYFWRTSDSMQNNDSLLFILDGVEDPRYGFYLYKKFKIRDYDTILNGLYGSIVYREEVRLNSHVFYFFSEDLIVNKGVLLSSFVDMPYFSDNYFWIRQALLFPEPLRLGD